MIMAVQVSYPGVYIDEFAPGAPIQGVGTSTAAFIGPAAAGELNTPTKITSWDRFREVFGEQPLPGFFLWYAVRGFFENGGQVCYIVRASNGGYDEIVLEDRTGNGAPGNPLIRLRARQPGHNAANPIQVTVTDAHVIPNTTRLFRPAGTLAAAVTTGTRELTLGAAEGVNFKPGDIITIAALGERLRILRVVADTLRLEVGFVNDYIVGDAVRLADTAVNARTIRIRPTAALVPGVLVPGTVLTITQGTATESQIVESVQTEPLGAGEISSYRVIFRRGFNTSFSLDPVFPDDPIVQSEEFNLTVARGAGSTIFNNLAIDAAHPRYFEQVINNAGGLVEAELIEPPPPVSLPLSLPAATGAAIVLTGGTNEQLPLLDQHYIDALETLRDIDDVNIIAIPDRNTDTVQQALIAHCEQMADRFAVLDALTPVPDQPLFGPDSIETQRLGLDSTRGYAGLYGPMVAGSTGRRGCTDSGAAIRSCLRHYCP
jgi:hypothetical protein